MDDIIKTKILTPFTISRSLFIVNAGNHGLFGKTVLHISALLALLTFEGKFCGFVHARDSA